MYVDIAIAVVAVLLGILAVGIWWERAVSRRNRATHARRQSRRAGYAWAYSRVYGRDKKKLLTYQPPERDEKP